MGGTRPNGSWTEGISRNIARLVEERGTSKHAIQQASGIPRSTFYRKLNDHPELFSAGELGTIAEKLGVTLADLLSA